MNNLGLERFITAQEHTYNRALTELKSGEKKSHWMWFIFPQLKGLGRSSMAYTYGIAGTDEAKAYLEHPVLGKRLIECCEALLVHTDKSAEDILGAVDGMKLRSAMTLFALVSEEDSVFRKVLDRFYNGQTDIRTFELLGL